MTRKQLFGGALIAAGLTAAAHADFQITGVVQDGNFVGAFFGGYQAFSVNAEFWDESATSGTGFARTYSNANTIMAFADVGDSNVAYAIHFEDVAFQVSTTSEVLVSWDFSGDEGPGGEYAESFLRVCGPEGELVNANLNVPIGSSELTLQPGVTYTVRGASVASQGICQWSLVRTPGKTVTYQGRLNDAGGPFTGSADMQFTVWTEESGGVQIDDSTSQDVVVSDGLFTTQLMFAKSTFDGSERWLQVSVDGVTLSPRQAITPAPSSIFATIAENATSAHTAASADVAKTVEITFGEFHLPGHLRIDDNELFLRPDFDLNHGLGWYGQQKPFDGVNVDGPVLYGFSGGLLGTTIGGQQAVLSWNLDGRVGIGTSSPGFTLEVNGNAANTTGVWTMLSDERTKEDIEPLTGSLERLLALDPVTFEYRDDAPIDTDGRRAGLLAQQVGEVFPEWVRAGEDGLFRLEMTGFEAHAVEAIKQLHEASRHKDMEITALRRELDALKALVAERLQAEEN